MGRALFIFYNCVDSCSAQMALLILVGSRNVILLHDKASNNGTRWDLGSSFAFWVVKTLDGAITSTWLVVLGHKSIDALNSYGQLLFDKDIPITTVLFITTLQG